jgi:hypothetical protein
VVEEKTFGLKNKNKSKKVQQKIEQMKSSVTGTDITDEYIAFLSLTHIYLFIAGDREAQKKAEAKKQQEEAKRMAAIRAAENAALLAGSVVIKQKEVPPGVDPKSIVCEFFRHQRCNKGNKCKFAHDLKVDMKAAKIDLFSDAREASTSASGEPAKEDDDMANWSAEKLAQVVDSKQDLSNRNLPTKIVCKYFLEAIENQKYGWFWECPNGGKKCMYRHALPEGYVLRRDKKRLDEEREAAPTLEELIEHERNKIGVGTPVNEATFAAWMRRKRRAAARKRIADQAARDVAIKQGKEKMSGRETFLQNPSLANAGDDDDADALEFDAAEYAGGDGTAATGDDGAPVDGAEPDDTPMKVWETSEYLLNDDDDAADAADLAILVAAKQEAKRKYDAGASQRALDAAQAAADAAADADDDNNEDGGDGDNDDGGDDGGDEDGDGDNDDGGDGDDGDDDGDNDDDDDDDKATGKQKATAAPAIDASVFAGENVDELPDFDDE